MAKKVNFAKCGTQESWQKYKQNYQGMHTVIPATLYVNEEGICLVTSQEWVDWLLDRRDTIPQGETE